MVKNVFFIFFMAVLMVFVSSLYAKEDDKNTRDDNKKMTVSELMEQKCSQCHKPDQAKKMHKSKRSFLEIIMRMQKKEGVNLSDKEVENIAEFLAAPSRQVLTDKCLQCHGFDKIMDAHNKGVFTIDTIKRMQKKGVDVSDQEADKIYDHINKGYYPVPPVHPGVY